MTLTGVHSPQGISTPAPAARFGAAPALLQDMLQSKPDAVTFGASEPASKHAATVEQEETLAEIYREDFDADEVPAFAYYMDAATHREYLKPSGAVGVFVDILKSAAPQLDDPANGTAYLLVDYPSEQTVKKVKENIEQMNKLLKPRGFKDKLLNASFRAMLGGSQPPVGAVEIRVNPDNPTQCGFKIPVENASQRDLRRFMDIMENAPPALMNALKMFSAE